MTTTVALPPRDPAEPRDVARELIRFIQTSDLEVGDRLPSIRQLATRLKASSSVVRDAMLQAETMGLIKILPRSGAFVQTVDYAPLVDAFSETLEGSLLQVDHHLFHLLESRQLIEEECVRQAATRRRLEDLLPLRDELDAMDAALRQIHSPQSEQSRRDFLDADIRFHLGIAQICGNPVLSTMLRSLLGLLRPHLAQLPWNEQRKRVTQEAHDELYQALLEGDAQSAADGMNRHLRLAYDGLLKRVWSKKPAGQAQKNNIDARQLETVS